MSGFIHSEEGKLVDGDGRPLILRGVGLGNWLLPEGYMWKFEPPGPQSPREIEALIEGLVGPPRGNEFWRLFRAGFIAEADVARIRAEGFNHVRLPINSRVVMAGDGELIETGFAYIDSLIEWCRRHQLWVVLDLHGAPGGQTGTNIDDSPHGKPELFTDGRYRALTVKLWRAIAQRYRDEFAIAAYDLLNEPLPNEHQHTFADQLRDLYLELTTAIRQVDPNHAISYEGSHWATNWSIFTEVWDRNSILQFHKYWSPPDRPSIQKYLDIGRDLGVPVYMGEGGENNLGWIQTAFQLYDDCAISWNFWTWKKLETRTSPCSVNAPAGWDEIVAYAARRGPKPAPAKAWRILRELADVASIARCTYRPELISALLRRPPLRIPAFGFGFRGPGNSYQTSGGIALAGFRGDDLVTIRRPAGADSEPINWHHAGGAERSSDEQLLVSLGTDDWVSYDFMLEMSTEIRVVVSLQAGDVAISVDGRDLEGNPALPVWLREGRHTVRLTGLVPQTLVRWIDVTPSGREPEAKREEGIGTVA